MKPRNLPPLEVGTAYLATDFEEFEYSGAVLTGSKAILRLQMKNATTIDLPASDDELRVLMHTLMEAFPVDARKHALERGWSA